MQIIYAPSFLNRFKKLHKKLQEEAFEKIDLFKNKKNHQVLKVHKLKGRLRGRYSFSVNYKVRILFKKKGNEFHFLDIGDHDIYDI
jgi:toxin HigB-1